MLIPFARSQSILSRYRLTNLLDSYADTHERSALLMNMAVLGCGSLVWDARPEFERVFHRLIRGRSGRSV